MSIQVEEKDGLVSIVANDLDYRGMQDLLRIVVKHMGVLRSKELLDSFDAKCMTQLVYCYFSDHPDADCPFVTFAFLDKDGSYRDAYGESTEDEEDYLDSVVGVVSGLFEYMENTYELRKPKEEIFASLKKINVDKVEPWF